MPVCIPRRREMLDPGDAPPCVPSMVTLDISKPAVVKNASQKCSRAIELTPRIEPGNL